MPIPPSLSKALSYTQSGIQYATVLDNYDENWAANANQIVIHAIIGWEDRADFLNDVVGYTTWTSPGTTLSRVVPLVTPDGSNLWCDDVKLVKKGIIGSDGALVSSPTLAQYGNLADPFLGNWPTWDWAMYRLTFGRPQHFVLTDSQLATQYSSLEQFRYTQVSSRYSPRMRKKPGYVFEYDQTAAFTIGGSVPTPWQPGDTLVASEEVGFLPDYQVEYLLTWKQVPLNAVPLTAIQGAINTLNSASFSFLVGGVTWTFPAGLLMFKGPANPISWYQGADSSFYVDLQYTLAFQPGGWNNYQLNMMSSPPPPALPERLYAPIRARGVTPTTPPFVSTNFQDLFTPASS